MPPAKQDAVNNQHRVLVVGSGGREHCIVWKLAQSPHVGQVLVMPGNGGTDGVLGKSKNVSGSVEQLVSVCRKEKVDMVVVGPEAPLAEGVADALKRAGIPCFGPSAKAARIEASKSFAKDFMKKFEIPTADYRVFSDFKAASEFVQAAPYPVVIKASGLAAGKGVVLPENAEAAVATLKSFMVDKVFGKEGEEVVVEERLEGEEASVLAFTDGFTVAVMPPAQDHKRLKDGDQGPNTGGMGAYAPAPVVSADILREIRVNVLQRAVDGLRKSGTPFVGVLYAGIMLTKKGVRVLEFNCRLGDPETQVLLPLLQTDLFEIVQACTEGCLDSIDVRFSSQHAATVVLAADGYPGSYEKGAEVKGVEAVANAKDPSMLVFHAGTARNKAHGLVTAGGRVLAVTGVAKDLKTALARAYSALKQISFKGMQHRTDIGHRAAASTGPAKKSLYAQAGVDIEAGNESVRQLKKHVQSTYNKMVLSDVGSFGGLFDGKECQEMKHPVLVGSTDGVGTKIKIAAKLKKYNTVGSCLVNHCVNDILVQGAHPLFFLDYVAASKITPEMIAAVVEGCSKACVPVNCALLGGETAEMPGVYQEGEFDIAGTIVGVVEKDDLIDGHTLSAGDVILSLESTGLHTNGYSLARKVLEGFDYEKPLPELGGRTLADALLAIHRPYLTEYRALKKAGINVKGMAHITGGGLIDNPPRIFPENVAAAIVKGSWEVLPIFKLIQSVGKVPDEEMAHVFNLGLGMLVFVPKEQVQKAMDTLKSVCKYPVNIVGEMIPRAPNTPPVVFRGNYTFWRPVRVGVLGSTRGTDLQYLIDHLPESKLNASIEVVVSNKEDALILEKAKKHNITSVFVSPKNKTREEYDEEVAALLESHQVDVVLLIGYMRILSKPFVDKFRNRIMNVHPSLLPAFAGGMDLQVHEAVLKAGVQETGCTVHFVDEGVDSGTIIVQRKCPVDKADTAESLKSKVQALEGPAFMEALQKFVSGSLKL